MNIKFIVGNALAGTLALALAGYVQDSVSASSDLLLETQAQTCPALLDQTENLDKNPTNRQLAVPVRPNELLDLTLLCSSGSADIAGSDSMPSITGNALRETPQSATQFDQLPQDRVELDGLL
ncbi:MAG: hypothetical protein AAF821_02795 [Cyanobacteria bacterium P01_D01_bin.156]